MIHLIKFLQIVPYWQGKTREEHLKPRKIYTLTGKLPMI